MGGLLIAGRDALVVLVAGALLVSLGGVFLWGWPILVALLTDGRTYLAIGVALFALALVWMRRQERQELPALPASEYCAACGSERPALICPMCGAVALEKMV